jgi:hypothetical protein
MGIPNQRIPKVAGVLNVFVGKDRIDIEIEPGVDIEKTKMLIEKKLEELRVHQMNFSIFESIGKSVRISKGYVRVELSDNLRVALGKNGMDALVNVIKTQDIDESTFDHGNSWLIVRPNKPGISSYTALKDAVAFYMDYIIVLKLRRPDAKRFIER